MRPDSSEITADEVVGNLERLNIDSSDVEEMARVIQESGGYPDAVATLRHIVGELGDVRSLLEDSRASKVGENVLVAIGSGLIDRLRFLYSSGSLDPFRSAIEDLFNKNTPVKQVSGSAEATVES